jgi:thiamine kinase-like enzyme
MNYYTINSIKNDNSIKRKNSIKNDNSIKRKNSIKNDNSIITENDIRVNFTNFKNDRCENEESVACSIDDNSIITENDIRVNFTKFKNDRCENEESVACSIDDDKINEISYFIAHIIPKCPNVDIKLDHIKNGNILSKGGMGYSFMTSNTDPNKKKIIKIAICTNESLLKNLKNEIDLHKEIVNSKKDMYIKLYGYYIRNSVDYEYYDYNEFASPVCKASETVKNINGCELYLILEAGDGDLYDNIKNKVIEHGGLENALNANKKYNVDSLIELLKFYQISEYFVEKEGKIFIHNDLKMENIVTKENKFKLIDFGLSDLTDKFFNFNYEYVKGTLFTYDILYNIKNNQNIKSKKNFFYIRSPLYDMFCICIAIFEFICIQTIDNFTQDRNIYQTMWEVNDVLERHNFSNEIRKLINNLTKLTVFIYEFHDNNTKKFLKDYNYNNFFSNNDMEKMICPKINDKKPPIYVKTGNKLKDDYEYFDKIVKYFVPELEDTDLFL